MIKPVVENVEFEVWKQWPDVLHGFELLELVRMDVDHEPLKVAKIVAVEARLVGCELAVADFFDQWGGEVPAVRIASDDHGLAFVGNDFGFAGNFAETKLLTILLDGGFASLGVIRV